MQLKMGDARGNFSHLQSDTNVDGVHLPIERFVVDFSNEQRTRFLQACTLVLGAGFVLRREDANNDLSVQSLFVDGIPLNKCSTGTRLIFRLLVDCFDPSLERILIDEPELGLAPDVQKRLYGFLHNADVRSSYLPHLRSIVVATHSHLFLDKSNYQNNFSVSKSDGGIHAARITTIQQLNQLQFSLLGNELDTYLLPAAIVVVEGVTDVDYIRRVVAQRHPLRHVIVVSSEGDAAGRVRAFSQMIGGASTTPYFDRTFAILDSVAHGTSRSRVAGNNINLDHVIQWENNGIEYLYPVEIMMQKFRCDAAAIATMSMTDGDNISINGLTYRKRELAQEVCALINEDTVYPHEFETKFLRPLAHVLE